MDYDDHRSRTPRQQNNAARDLSEPTTFTTIEENDAGRVIECAHGRNVWWAVHLWDRPDRRAFTIEGVYRQVSGALAALADA